MKKYTAPEFDVTAYEVEDIITSSGLRIGTDGNDASLNTDGWVEINN